MDSHDFPLQERRFRSRRYDSIPGRENWSETMSDQPIEPLNAFRQAYLEAWPATSWNATTCAARTTC
jgi:hypothetical protein